jgi:hypothetical protein
MPSLYPNRELIDCLSNLNDLFDKQAEANSILCRNNEQYFKILATVKNDLERAIKNPSNLLDTVFASIDALRSFTPYYSTDLGKNKIDPPLTDEEKDTVKKKFLGA